jgi:hypothetical protein
MVAAIALVSGCSREPDALIVVDGVGARPPQTEMERRVIANAQAEIARRGGSPRWHSYTASHHHGGWRVYAVRIEGYDSNGNEIHVAGGHCDVILDEQGIVKDYYPGL